MVESLGSIAKKHKATRTGKGVDAKLSGRRRAASDRARKAISYGDGWGPHPSNDAFEALWKDGKVLRTRKKKRP